MFKKKKNSQRGAAQAPLIIGLLLLGLALPAALRLVQQRQETRKSAADNQEDCEAQGHTWCGSGTCPDGWSYGPGCWTGGSCSSRHEEACADHQGGGGGDDGGTDCSGVYNADLSGYSCEGGELKDADGNTAGKQKWCGTGCPSTVESNSDCCNGQDICQCSGGGGDGGTQPTAAPTTVTPPSDQECYCYMSCDTTNCQWSEVDPYRNMGALCDDSNCITEPTATPLPTESYVQCDAAHEICVSDWTQQCESGTVDLNRKCGQDSGGYKYCCQPKSTATATPGGSGGTCTNNGGDCKADSDCCSGICDLSGGMPGVCRNNTCEGTCKEEVPGNYNCASYGLVYGDGECQSGWMCCKESDEGLSDGTVCEVADTTAMANCSDCNSGEHYCEGTTCYCGAEPTSEPGDLEDGAVCEVSDTTAMPNCDDCENGYHKTSSTSYACGPLGDDCLDDGFDCSWIGGGEINCSNCCNGKHFASITKGYICGPGELLTCQWDSDPDAGVCRDSGCHADEESVGQSNCWAPGIQCCVPEEEPEPEIVDCQSGDECVFADECSGELKTDQKCDLVLQSGGGEYKYCCSRTATCDSVGTVGDCGGLNCCSNLTKIQESVGLCKCVSSTQELICCCEEDLSTCTTYGGDNCSDISSYYHQEDMSVCESGVIPTDTPVPTKPAGEATNTPVPTAGEGEECQINADCGEPTKDGCEVQCVTDYCPGHSGCGKTEGSSGAVNCELYPPAGYHWASGYSECVPDSEPTGGGGGEEEQGCKPCPDGSYASKGTTSFGCQTDGTSLDDFIGWKEQYIKVFYENEQIPEGEMYADYNCDGKVGIDDVMLWTESYLNE